MTIHMTYVFSFPGRKLCHSYFPHTGNSLIVQFFHCHLPDQMSRSLATAHELVKNVSRNGSRSGLHCHHHIGELGLSECPYLIVERWPTIGQVVAVAQQTSSAFGFTELSVNCAILPAGSSLNLGPQFPFCDEVY